MDTISERRQADFDKVWAHFVTNRGRPGVKFASCVLDSGAANCAIGLLTSRDQHAKLGTIVLARRLYSPEDYNVYITSRYAERVDALPLRPDLSTDIPAFIREDPAFYSRLQHAHDRAAMDAGCLDDAPDEKFSVYICEGLEHFARHYNLLLPE